MVRLANEARLESHLLLRTLTSDRQSTAMNRDLAQTDAEATGGIGELLQAARRQQLGSLGALLELYRNYLTILATTQLDRRLQRRVSPSDLVQETMLAAHQDFSSFRGESEREFLAWLRQILIHRLYRAIEVHLKSKRRDVRCEVSMEQACTALHNSAVNLTQVLADREATPSTPLQQQERAVAIANQLAKLAPQYREVIVLRNLQGLSFDEIAQRMHRNAGAVRMLWLRAVEKFKAVYEPVE